MLEPETNPNPSYMVDPPTGLRRFMQFWLGRVISPELRAKRRARIERGRRARGEPHIVEYFHQLDDPYSYLAAQVLQRFTAAYGIKLVFHLVEGAGLDNQPEKRRLAHWARRDAALIAPHYGLDFPEDAPLVPSAEQKLLAARAVLASSPATASEALLKVSQGLWTGEPIETQFLASDKDAAAALAKGTKRLSELGHYSGAMFYYGGEWYWGIERLQFLEERLRGLGACRDASAPYLCPRPQIDCSPLNGCGMELDFFPSLNSPYTSIIYDKVIELVDATSVRLNHKPVLPMIMRGVPATREKGNYIFVDTRREAEYLGVPFGPFITPIGKPVRRLYSLLPYAASQGKDVALLSAGLKLSFSMGGGIHRQSGLKRAVAMAGLDWEEAKTHLGDEEWKEQILANQMELNGELDLWGVPCFRLKGPKGHEDLSVWGQDRLWLVAHEIQRRASLAGKT